MSRTKVLAWCVASIAITLVQPSTARATACTQPQHTTLTGGSAVLKHPEVVLSIRSSCRCSRRPERQ